MFAPDLRSDLRWLSSGFLMMLCSSFGQTYFIGLFAGYLKTELSLTDGDFGSLYTLATLGSACLLMWAGRLADTMPTRALGVGVMAGLAVTCAAMASVASAWMLGLVLLGLRFFGQGMLTHVAMTAVGRWFSRKRGRAVAIVAMGFPAGEAVMPVAAVAVAGAIGWRQSWVAAAALLALLALPVLFALLKHERRPSTPDRALRKDEDVDSRRREWTRGEVLRSPSFYGLMPVVLATPFIVTGIFINQAEIVESKGWQLTWFAASFPVLAAVHVVAGLGAGWIVDRFGARRLLPAFLVPLGIGIVLLIFAASPYMLPVFMVLLGLTHGSSSTLQGALWPELFGTLHLGAIRSLVTAGIVFASALSPALMGFLLDAGISLEAQLAAMAAYCFAGALWVAGMMPRLKALTAA